MESSPPDTNLPTGAAQRQAGGGRAALARPAWAFAVPGAAVIRPARPSSDELAWLGAAVALHHALRRGGSGARTAWVATALPLFSPVNQLSCAMPRGRGRLHERRGLPVRSREHAGRGLRLASHRDAA